MSGPLPERVILDLLNTGIDALVSDLSTSSAGDTVIDDILSVLDSDERVKAREYFASHYPDVVLGYPRQGVAFPLIALILQSDSEANRYVGLGEHAEETDGVKTGKEFADWTQGQFGIYVYAEHPDICAWYYRIARRVLQVGKTYLINNNLDNPVISGAELAPDPRYTADNLFVRRLVLNVEYEESWTDRDYLWESINGAPEEFITDSATGLDVRHVDSRDPLDGGSPGGIEPYSVDLD